METHSQELRQRGFTVVHLDREDASAIESSRQAAHSFFTMCTSRQKAHTSHLAREMTGERHSRPAACLPPVDRCGAPRDAQGRPQTPGAPTGGLVGYSRPHADKEVFRVRRGVTGHNPWPSCPAAFGEFGEEAFGACERVARQMLDAVAAACHDLGGPAQQRLLSSADFAHACQDRDHSVVCASPFDYFLYHPTPAGSGHDVPRPLCGEHVDPGLLTVVPGSAVAGLAVRRLDTGAWTPVEEGLWRAGTGVLDGPDAGAPTACVVLAGKALEELTGGRFGATVHRVDHCGARTRLSCVYELRTLTSLRLQKGPMAAKPVL